MKGANLTARLVLFAVALAVIEGALMGAILHASGVLDVGYVLLAAGVGAFMTMLVGLFVIRQVTRPLERLARAADEIGGGRLDVEIEVPGTDELARLATAFRDMQARLAETYADLEHRVEARTAELRETSDFLGAVLDSSTDYAIIATDTDWTIQTFNTGARLMFGHAPEDVVGASLEVLVPGEEREAAMGEPTRQMLELHGRIEGEAVRVRATGERFPVRAVTTVRRDPDGAPLGYTLIMHDITSRKVLEGRLRDYTDNLEQHVAEKTAQLQEANEALRRANRLKSQFLANMSHELRTPLNAIIGFAEAIRDGLAGEVSEEQSDFAEDINQAGRQLLAMINNILDFSKLEAGAMALSLEPLELGALVDEVFRIVRGLARGKGVALEQDLVPRPLEMTADPVKLKQVLYNLLANAVKFTDAGGWVTVRARLETETVILEVEDTGIGIAPEDQVWIFEEFRQADSSLARGYQGTGLGLALVKRLVELHGGEITVESEVGQGTTFTLVLLRDLVTEAEAGVPAARGGEGEPS